ncbi:MAG: NAD(P)H-hydrate dehydratase [Clostridiaceae bacterium]
MRIADIEMMRGMDQEANLTFGIPSIILMENAAIGVLKNLDLLKTSYVIVAGPGNNGGDGFALARHLHALGKNVNVFILSKDGLIKGDAKVNYDILLKLKISVEMVSDEKHLLSLKEAVKDADVTIDALLGTGAKGPLSDLFMKAIEIMNDYSEMIISIDVPSGLDADTGLAMPVAVRATKTISFQCIKKGYLNEKALDFVGELIVEDIGIPELAMKLVDNEVYMTEALDMERILPLREKAGYKSRYGRVLVVAGSRGLTGAAKISSEAAIATGSGLVTLSSHEDIMNDLVPILREIMSLYPQDLEEGVRKSDVVAFGPGLGNTEETLALLLRVIKTMQEEGMKSSTLVIDADGLNVIEGKCEILKSLNFNVILTPHPGEMARLTGLSVKEITSNRIEIAREFAKTYDVVLVLKGYHTVITDGKVVYVNPTGSSAMAQGGMGDALTGIIASLAGQGIKPMDAAIFGVYIHGSIGDRISRERYSVKASEIIEKIPYHMKQILDCKIKRSKSR